MEEKTSKDEILTSEQMLAEILVNSRKTKNYMKWQLIITVALVVIPLIATLAMIPFAMKSISSIYGVSSGIDGGNVEDAGLDSLNQLLK